MKDRNLEEIFANWLVMLSIIVLVALFFLNFKLMLCGAGIIGIIVGPPLLYYHARKWFKRNG